MSKPIYIIGISAFYHDAAACILKDGKIIAACHEERFSRIKHDENLPVNAINFCLKQVNININEVDYIAYYEKPILKFDRILNTFIKTVPKGFIPFKMALKSWLKEKLWVSSVIKKKLNYKGEIKFCKHHESHAASAYFTSKFNESAFLTIDGVGEKATTTYGIAKDNKLTTLNEIHFPHSLGLLYSAFTYYCGFMVNSGEYKLMGLAPYGKPIYTDLIKAHLIQIKPNGSYTLNMEYFGYEYSLKMITSKFCKLFGNKARLPDDEMADFYKDIAASIQKVTEEVILSLAKHVKTVSQQKNLCLAGGVALNCVANSVLQSANIFKNIWVYPASGDGGTAVGAALLIWHQHLNNPKQLSLDDLTNHSYLGPDFNNHEISSLLDEHSIQYHQFNENELIKKVADLISNKAVVGWFAGKSEFGPRALGNRSILASPVFSDMQQHLNIKIKKREGFRPFAPIVMEEYANEWFDLPNHSKSMLFTYPCIQPEKIPSCVHVDNSARVQTINKHDNKKIHLLLDACYKKTSIPVLINTSFNVRGEPMVNSPFDAISCFFNTDMDVLVMENILILKKEQPTELATKFLKHYELD
jgi:carbamoyltransferase